MKRPQKSSCKPASGIDRAPKTGVPLARPVLAPSPLLLALRAPPQTHGSRGAAPSNHIRKLLEEETAANQTAATTLPTSVPRKFQLRDPSSLEQMTRRETKVEQYGSGERLHGVVDDLFSPAEAERLHRELDRDADKGSCDRDVLILSKQLHPQALLLFTRVGADGLVASTTLCGHKHFGKQIGMDALARLCMLPWTAHVVNTNGALSLQYAENTEAVLWTRFAESALAVGGAATGTPGRSATARRRGRARAKIEALQRQRRGGAMSRCNKAQARGDGGGGANGSAKHDEHMARDCKIAMASRVSAVEGCAGAIAHIAEKAEAMAARGCRRRRRQRAVGSPPSTTRLSGFEPSTCGSMSSAAVAA